MGGKFGTSGSWVCGRQGVSGAMIGFTWEVVLGLHISGCVGGRTFLVRCWVSIWKWAWVDERVGIKIVSVDRWLLGEMVVFILEVGLGRWG